MKVSTSTVCALLVFVAISLAIPAPLPQPVSYDGIKVVRINLDSTSSQAQAVSNLIQRLKLETWTDVVKPNHAVDIMVLPEKLAAFDQDLSGIGVTYKTMHEDLGASIRAESEPAVKTFDVGQQAADMSWFNAYHSYADHISYLSQLVAKFPGRAKVVTAGKSYEGREITGIHIYGNSGGGSKQAVILHGTVHAREWITTMVTEFLVYQLLNNYLNSTKVKAYVDKYDYYIFPVINPDGFVFSQHFARLWRKNRAPVVWNACVGTDINRNWNIKWFSPGGASINPCDQDYKGPFVGSTPEFKALSSFQNSKAFSQGVKLFMDIHSYSQFWMIPYGYSCAALPSNSLEQISLARGAVEALRKVYGTTFTTGPTCATIYKVTGGSVDYAYDVTGANYSFALELRDTGNYGFVLPPGQIYPSGNEMWAAFMYVLENMV